MYLNRRSRLQSLNKWHHFALTSLFLWHKIKPFGPKYLGLNSQIKSNQSLHKETGLNDLSHLGNIQEQRELIKNLDSIPFSWYNGKNRLYHKDKVYNFIYKTYRYTSYRHYSPHNKACKTKGHFFKHELAKICQKTSYRSSLMLKISKREY